MAKLQINTIAFVIRTVTPPLSFLTLRPWKKLVEWITFSFEAPKGRNTPAKARHESGQS